MMTEPVQDPGPYVPHSEAANWGFCAYALCEQYVGVMIERPYCSQRCRRAAEERYR